MREIGNTCIFLELNAVIVFDEPDKEQLNTKSQSRNLLQHCSLWVEICKHTLPLAVTLSSVGRSGIYHLTPDGPWP